MLTRRSMERQAHYVDLEAQPQTGPEQADLRHLVASDSAAEPAATTIAPTATAQSTAAQPSPALNPTAKASSTATSAQEPKSKSNTKGSKEASAATPTTPPAPSIQDTSTRILQQVFSSLPAWLPCNSSQLQRLEYSLLVLQVSSGSKLPWKA